MDNAASQTHPASLPNDGELRRTRADERQIGPDERLMTLTEATGLLPRIDGKKVAVCTLWRWCRKGLRGKYLDYVRVGRRICTTRQALLRFFTDLADLDERVVSFPKTLSGRGSAEWAAANRRTVSRSVALPGQAEAFSSALPAVRSCGIAPARNLPSNEARGGTRHGGYAALR